MIDKKEAESSIPVLFGELKKLTPGSDEFHAKNDELYLAKMSARGKGDKAVKVLAKNKENAKRQVKRGE